MNEHVSGSARDRVEYEFECRGRSDLFLVNALEAEEALSKPYWISVHVEALSDDTDATELLGCDARVTLTRGGSRRELSGLVTDVRLEDTAELRQTAVELRSIQTPIRCGAQVASAIAEAAADTLRECRSVRLPARTTKTGMR